MSGKSKPATGAPAHLTATEKAIWDSYAGEFDATKPSVRGLLEVVAVQLAAARRANERVEAEGQMISINGGKTDVAHPLIRVAREASALAARSIKELRREAEIESRSAPKAHRPLGIGKPGRPRAPRKSPRVTDDRAK